MTSTVEADDSLMTLSRLTYAYGATTVFDASYVRDSIGRIVQAAETVLGATTTRSFVYDSIGRLRQVRVGGVAVADYGYDANGNRTSLVTSGGSVVGAFDAQDRLLSYGANVYSYSSNGELVRKVSGSDTTRYVYDAAGNLLQVRLGKRHDDRLLGRSAQSTNWPEGERDAHARLSVSEPPCADRRARWKQSGRNAVRVWHTRQRA